MSLGQVVQEQRDSRPDEAVGRTVHQYYCRHHHSGNCTNINFGTPVARTIAITTTTVTTVMTTANLETNNELSARLDAFVKKTDAALALLEDEVGGRRLTPTSTMLPVHWRLG